MEGTPEGIDKLDYTIKYDVSLSDWTHILLELEIFVDNELVNTVNLRTQRVLRRRGLFGKREPSDEGTHLEGRAEMQTEESEEPTPLATLQEGQWLGFRVTASYALDPEDDEAPQPKGIVADFPRLHVTQLNPPFGNLEQPRMEHTVPFAMTIRYQLPSDTSEATDGAQEGEESHLAAPPSPFASLHAVEWINRYGKVMKTLHEGAEMLIEEGTLTPEDGTRASGSRWKHDERDALPHDFVFSDPKPKTLSSGEFLDAVPTEDLQQFIFPQHELCSHSAARLLIFARYGPLDEGGVLRGGKGREVPLPEHFSYRWPKSYAAPSACTTQLMKPKKLATIEKTMKVKELDEVDTVVEMTTNPALKMMIEQIEREDQVLSLADSADMSSKEQNEIMAEVLPRVRKAVNPEPADVQALLVDLPRDCNGHMSFADIQQKVINNHEKRVAASRLLVPADSEIGVRNRGWKAAPAKIGSSTANKVKTNKDEEALLSQYVFSMAELEDGKYPGLRQNVQLTRKLDTTAESILSTKKRWDKECCVRQKDTAWMKKSKLVL